MPLGNTLAESPAMIMFTVTLDISKTFQNIYRAESLTFELLIS